MNARVTWGLAICVVGLAAGNVRAQDYGSYLEGQHQISHAAAAYRMGGNYHPHGPGHLTHNLHEGAMVTWHGHHTTPVAHGCFLCPHGCYGNCPNGCHHGDPCDPNCPPGHCPHGLLRGRCAHCLAGLNLKGHHHYWSYSQPAGLVYPPAHQPPAVVQYPYYTVKGPDDFFLQRTPGYLP